ncbi:hypothetical protein BDY17DRAFT_54720 [Neohortaea acidophila]|uniref:Uncharacterized protein n=1 Tax=Neohortaea acidophila TaxID=245834 RepID=A0A6A6PG25_9PEZI|nr:uncharacterized protein BDY17DRAFT_54720 [Neohortaea acidophila]KAF2478583.1 hypothetical protein BDY17DRAFT_54720 [Neohortaea acidophila]
MMELELLESGIGHVYSVVPSYIVSTRDIYKGKGKDIVLVKGLTKHIHPVELPAAHIGECASGVESGWVCRYSSHCARGQSAPSLGGQRETVEKHKTSAHPAAFHLPPPSSPAPSLHPIPHVTPSSPHQPAAEAFHTPCSRRRSSLSSAFPTPP